MYSSMPSLIYLQEAMKSINSRRGQDITHLLDLTLPRPYYQPQLHRGHRQQRRNPTWGLGSGYHAVDKARYVHANYRFVVHPEKEYHTQAVDPDVHVDWDSVLQVLASYETQLASCPICLSEVPVAPRMAKCGHIFCLPCLIRYMHAIDDTTPAGERRARWKKCPICEDSIYVSETRPVKWLKGQAVNLLEGGGDVLLRLLMREPGSTLALPRDEKEGHGHVNDIPWYNVAEVVDYARFMKGGQSYMLAQCDREISEIEEMERDDELMFGDDNTWTRKAIAAVTDSKHRYSGIGEPPVEIQPTKENHNLLHTPMNDNRLTTSPFADPVFDDMASSTFSSQSSLPTPPTLPEIQALHLNPIFGKSPPSMRNAHAKSRTIAGRPPGHPYLFYHVLPNYFLSPLDIRILQAAFGNYTFFPSTLLPQVEFISRGHIVDDELRKRFKYLGHLPFGCEVSFLECDWTDLIRPEILERFADDINRRRKKNGDKAAREERERIRAEKAEDAEKWAAVRRRRPSITEQRFSESDFQALSETFNATDASQDHNSDTISTSPPWAARRSRSSFAMLASPGTSPDAPRTVWGTAAVQASTPPMQAMPMPQQPLEDGWLQDWEKDLLDNDEVLAIAEASSASIGGAKGGQGKKKKNKKITLMSTNARRGA